MAVLYVIPGDGQGMNMIFAKRQAQALEQHGLRVEILYLPTGIALRTQAHNVSKLHTALRRRRWEVVHANYGSMTSFLCATLTRDPLVISFRGSDLLHIGGVHPFKLVVSHLLSQFSAVRATRIVCVSEKLKEQLWWSRERVEVIPSGVDLELFRPVPREVARSVLSWEQRGPVLLFIPGRNPIGKGLSLVRAGFALAREEIADLELEIVDGHVEPDEMRHLYNASDCLVLASDTEGSPNVVKEAMACNLPVVSTDVGDVAIRLSSVSPSFVVERSPRRIADAVVEVLHRGERSNGRERSADFSQEAVTTRLIALYRTIRHRQTTTAHS